ncbi:MAG: hypothetical protein SGJ27_01580 [Candidatus Melainabacteria bacterium]|nr:hypothetical protein [Candidatus Melainabacteria bacterium]
MVLIDRDSFAQLLRASSLAVAVLLGYSTMAFATEAKAAEDPALKKAVSLYGNASYSQAITEFDKLASSKSNGEISRYYRALCYQQQKQYKAAKDEYLYLYYKAQNKNVRYKAWQALKTLPQVATQTARRATSQKTALAKDGPGADAWITPGEGYGRSGPEATSSVTVTIIPTSCGRRR